MVSSHNIYLFLYVEEFYGYKVKGPILAGGDFRMYAYYRQITTQVNTELCHTALKLDPRLHHILSKLNVFMYFNINIKITIPKKIVSKQPCSTLLLMEHSR